MGNKPPKGILLKINILLAVVITLISLISLSISEMDFYHAIVFASMGGFTLLLIGIVNIYVFDDELLEEITQSKKLRNRFLLSLLISPPTYYFSWVVFSPLAGVDPFIWFTKFRVFVILCLSSWLMNMLIIFFFRYVYMRHAKMYSEIENLQLKSIVSETANQMLKQQIHPHFLFNVLSTIKTLYKQDINQGEEYLVHLANFLRASISDRDSKTVRLSKELLLCADYIKMQQIRFGEALIFDFDLPEEVKHKKFLPYFSIQVLIENAIKHNILTEESPLQITVKLVGDYIEVTNNLQSKKNKESSTSQGLYNLSERYRLISGDEIEISQDENTFTVKIKLLENENSNY
ncbi:sensor histidine kinase [Chondrinema litorale]|uniref:sensor histidine kinase n=1 Tax=Chondrinema litorale TaxID=2994555 RepID=UPI0025437801|nr:histidine kinase [Chondrinema litorale]UZR97766.1 histidine kinase [Chondrinema litorale]